MLRFNILYSVLNKNSIKNKFLLNKNFSLLNKVNTKIYKNLFIPVFKFIIKYYLNFIYLVLFNYLNFFFKFIFIIIKKITFFNFFFNVNNSSVC